MKFWSRLDFSRLMQAACLVGMATLPGTLVASPVPTLPAYPLGPGSVPDYPGDAFD